MIYFLLLIPTLIVCYVVFLNICKYKFTVSEILISAAITYVIVGVTLNISAHITFTSVDIAGNLAFTGCLIVFAQKKTKSILLSGYYAFLAMVTSMIGSTVVTVLMDVVFRAAVEDSRSDLLLYLIAIVLTVLISFVIARYIGSHQHKCYIQLSSEIKKKFASYGFTLSALTYLIAHANIFLYQVVDDRALVSALEVIFVTTIFFVAIIMMAAYSLSQQKQAEALLRSEAEKDLSEHTKQLDVAYNEMRRFRHDYRNLLSSLMGYEDITELKTHLASSLSYADEALNNLDSLTACLNFINIYELKGLLAVKFAGAGANNVKVELNISEPVYDIALNRADLCRIIGIVLDNAIEEVMTHDVGLRNLSFSIVVDEAETVIVCSNAYKTAPLMRKIFDEGYSTKGVGRGLGLTNFKQICKENRNVMQTISVRDDEFVVVLAIRRV